MNSREIITRCRGGYLHNLHHARKFSDMVNAQFPGCKFILDDQTITYLGEVTQFHWLFEDAREASLIKLMWNGDT